MLFQFQVKAGEVLDRVGVFRAGQFAQADAARIARGFTDEFVECPARAGDEFLTLRVRRLGLFLRRHFLLFQLYGNEFEPSLRDSFCFRAEHALGLQPGDAANRPG